MTLKIQISIFVSGLLLGSIITGAGIYGIMNVEAQDKYLETQLYEAEARCGEKHPSSLIIDRSELLKKQSLAWAKGKKYNDPCDQDQDITNAVRNLMDIAHKKNIWSNVKEAGITAIVLSSIPYLLLTAIPFLWYYLLRRIRELSAAVIGK